MPLSTAAHNSARFTYVSPAGTVQRQDRQDGKQAWLRLVDGGYFENSGAVTASELVELVRRAHLGLLSEGAIEAPQTIRPIVLHIANDPAITDDPALEDNQRRFVNQLRAPFDALWHSREAHGAQARAALEDKVERHVLFRLCEEDATQPLPLGWSLSSAARDEMARQLDGPRNEARVNTVLDLLQGTDQAIASLRRVPKDCR
jgi:hypothetical protein